MKILRISLILSVLLLTLTAGEANASLLTLNKDGGVTWKVLSAQDEVFLETPKHSSVEVQTSPKTDSDNKSSVLVAKQDEKINLTVSTGTETKKLDVTDWKEDLLEIEERPQVQKIKVFLSEGKISLRQKGVWAVTDFPLSVDPKTAEISVKTESGSKFLSVLPYEATQSVLRTNLVNSITDAKIEILEEGENLAYKIAGERVFNFFNVYSYSIPASFYISASTGKVLKIDSPTFFRYLTFLFS